eukprot:144508_1
MIQSNSQTQISPAYLPPLATTPRFTVRRPRNNINNMNNTNTVGALNNVNGVSYTSTTTTTSSTTNTNNKTNNSWNEDSDGALDFQGVRDNDAHASGDTHAANNEDEDKEENIKVDKE